MVEAAFKVILGLFSANLNLDREDCAEVGSYLCRRVSHIKDFVKGIFFEKKGIPEVVDIGTLRRRLLKIKVLDKPTSVTVEGTFFPGLLLSSGWWERRGKETTIELPWKDNLQSWLFHGFEQWGPSWDISLSADSPGALLLAQIGSGDEVNSLPVIIPGEKARLVRQNLLEGQAVFEARVTGRLYHRSHLPGAVADNLDKWGKAFDYCILLDEEEKQHTVARQLDKTQTYSGYLWQCWGPGEWMQSGVMPRLDEVFFIWEHTDFTKPDAIAYNLDSLQHKADYLRTKYRDLVLLQKSASLVPGNPLCPTELFYSFIVGDLVHQ